MKKIRLILEFMGAVLLFLLAVAFIFYIKPSIQNKLNFHDKKDDTIFILNWGGIDSTQSYSVVYDHKDRGWMDHEIYYCLQLDNFNIQDKVAKEGWRYGPEKDQIFADAVEFAGDIGEYSKCFIDGGKPNTDKIQTYFWSIQTTGRLVGGMQVIMVEPTSRRLLYVDFSQ